MYKGLNLPAKDKMVDPAFSMHWAEAIPRIKADDGKSEVRQLGVAIHCLHCFLFSCH